MFTWENTYQLIKTSPDIPWRTLKSNLPICFEVMSCFLLQKIHTAMEKRQKYFKEKRKFLASNTSNFFTNHLSRKGYSGYISFDHRGETLNLIVSAALILLSCWLLVAQAVSLWVRHAIFLPHMLKEDCVTNPKSVCQGGSVIHKIFRIVINPEGGFQRAKALFGSMIKRPFHSLFLQEKADLYQGTGTLLLHFDCFLG